MLEKPNISDEAITSCLKDEYGLRVSQLAFLPLGADMGTAVYRVVAADGAVYFLKLRKGFAEITVTVPLFIKSQGIREIIAPVETTIQQGWADFGDYTMILYTFIEGKNGFDTEVTDNAKRILGAALRSIHSASIPDTLRQGIPRESFSAHFRESMKSFQEQAENQTFKEPTAAKLAEFIQSKRNQVNHLVERAQELADTLRSHPLEFVLCHTDLHGGNLLISDTGELYIVDWDNPLLAPKERDLMFIGGGIDEIWKSQRDEALFYEGYGQTQINTEALAYYRYERVIEDLVAFCEQLLLSDEGGADREQAYRWFTSNFKPGSTIDIARATDTYYQKES